MYYLAINHSEGWALNPYDNIEELLKEVKLGGTYGSEWKVLKELEVNIEEG